MSYRLVITLPDSIKPKLDACTASPAAVVRAIVLTHFGIDLVTMNPPGGKERAQPVHNPAPRHAPAKQEPENLDDIDFQDED